MANLRLIWRLLKLTAPFARWIALATLLGAATIGSGIGLMASSAYIIALAALHPPFAALQLAVVGVRFFGISRGVFRYAERLVSHQVTFRLLSRLRVWFYRAIEPLAPARLMRYKSGDLLSRVMADIETLEYFYGRVLAPPLVAIVTVGLVVGLFAWFDGRLSLALLLFLLLAGVGTPLLTRQLGRQPGRALVTLRASLNEALIDTVQGMADLLAFGQTERQQAQIRRLDDELVAGQARMAWLSGLGSALTGLFSNLATLAVLLIAIPLVSAGQLDGLYLALLALTAMASFEAVGGLPAAFQSLEQSLTAARRLFELVDAEPPLPPAPATSPVPLDFGLAVRDLHFSYGPDDPPALNGLSFCLPPGGCVAVVGSSGAGKSTLVNLLLRFWDYDQGRIELGGHDLRAYRPQDVRSLVSVVSQHTHLFNGTIRENLLLARPEASQAELIEAARQAQLHEFIQGLPQGYQTEIGEQGLGLSGGERQRLAIARALLKEAPLLVLDEATANLDALTEREVMAALTPLLTGRTTLIITHRLVGLEMADQILVLQEGRIVEAGRHEELVAADGLYRRMWSLQHQAELVEQLSSLAPVPAERLLLPTPQPVALAELEP